MRKWELEGLVEEKDESMEKAYDVILDGDLEAAQEILAEALGLEEGEAADDDGDEESEE